jgi:hypothetical protein
LRRDFFTPTTTEAHVFSTNARCDVFVFLLFFTCVMIQSAFVFCTYDFLRSIRILVDFAYVRIHGSFVTLWRIRILFLLVRIDSLLVYVWRVATYSYDLLDAHMIHEALLLCTYGKLRRIFIHIFTSYFFTARSLLCAYGSLRHIHILFFTYVFIQCAFLFVYVFSFTRTLPLVCVFSLLCSIPISPSPSPFLLLRTGTHSGVFVLPSLPLPLPSRLKRGGGLQRFLSSTCCVVRSDEFSLHEFFFLGYCEFSDTKNYLGKSSSCFCCYSFPEAFRKLLVVRFFLITSLGIPKDLRFFF